MARDVNEHGDDDDNIRDHDDDDNDDDADADDNDDDNDEPTESDGLLSNDRSPPSTPTHDSYSHMSSACSFPGVLIDSAARSIRRPKLGAAATTTTTTSGLPASIPVIVRDGSSSGVGVGVGSLQSGQASEGVVFGNFDEV